MDQLVDIAVEKLVEVIVDEINQGRCCIWMGRKCSEKKQEKIRESVRSKLETHTIRKTKITSI